MRVRTSMVLALFVCTLLVSLPAVASGGELDPGQRLRQMGVDACRQQEYARATALLSLYYNRYRLECAEEACRKEQVDVAMLIGECHYNARKSDLARSWFAMIVDRHSDDARACAKATYWIGKCESLDGNRDKAIEIWEGILSDYGDQEWACAKARIALSNLYQGHAHDSVAATDILRPLLDDDFVDNSGELLEELGWRLWTLNEKSKETRQTLDKLLEFAKNNWSPSQYAMIRVRIASSRGDHSLVIEEAERAMSETGDALLNVRFSRQRADALRHLGRTAESLEAYEDIIARFGMKRDRLTRSIVASALMHSAEALRDKGRTEEAKTRLQRVIALFPPFADLAKSELNRIDSAHGSSM